MTRLHALISSVFVRDEEEANLRAAGRPSAPWPSMACPLDCESIVPGAYPGPPYRRNAARSLWASRRIERFALFLVHRRRYEHVGAHER